MVPWPQLKAEAEQIVADTLADLPPEILAEALKVPVLFQKVCEDDPDIFGIYGHFEPGEVSSANGPIILYLETIDDFCLAEDGDFAEEVPSPISTN